jgi:DNA-binding transcriptional MerR regulator
MTKQRSRGHGEGRTAAVLPFRGQRQIALDAGARGGGHGYRRALIDSADEDSEARRRDSDGGGVGSGATRTLLGEDELRAIEAGHVAGITAVQIVEVFTSRGVKFSEASFRKYVQQGLLPRSRRVGRKGKHRGSLGVYPAKTVRRINSVKQWMADGFTIEQIQGQFLLYTDLVEGIEEGLIELSGRVATDLELPQHAAERKQLAKELGEFRSDSDRLVERAYDLARRVTTPKNNGSISGAAGSAEELL